MLDSDAPPAIGSKERPLIPQPHGGAIAPLPPGVSGNPRGRPTDAERLVAKLLKRHPGSLDKAADAWAEVLADSTNRHWLGALREAMDRTEGPVASQTHHHVSTDRAIVTHAPTGPAPELPGLPEPDKAPPEADISTEPPDEP